LGDLRLAVVGVGDALPGGLAIASTTVRTVLIIRTAIEYCQAACSRRSKTFVFSNPESALSSFTALAPARLTGAISSSQKRS
jgi:hypothetical protein